MQVSSLQLVLEMRAGEVRRLREELARLTHQLEEADTVRARLNKAEQRLEDLQEQLKQKVELEQ